MSELFADKLRRISEDTGRYQAALEKVKELSTQRALDGHFDFSINWEDLDKELFDSINAALKLLEDLKTEGFIYNESAFRQFFSRKANTTIYWGENND